MTVRPESTKMYPKDDEDDDLGDHLGSIANKYMKETSLHGLKYIAEDKRHWGERVFWICATIASWTMAIYMIQGVRDNQQSSGRTWI